MRRRIFRRGFKFGAVSLLVMAVLAPGAMGASPSDIHKDLADGRLDGSYTRAELKAYTRDAVVQGYGNPVVAGESGGQDDSPAQTPLAQTGTAGTLPFTGVELGLFALVGGGLLLGGVLLRSSTRTSGRKTSG